MPSKFTPPSVETVRAYCTEMKYPDFAEAFCTHHYMLGWIYGRHKTPIKDWKAAVRYWQSRNKDTPTRPELITYDAQRPMPAPDIPESPTSAHAQRIAQELLSGSRE